MQIIIYVIKQDLRGILLAEVNKRLEFSGTPFFMPLCEKKGL